MGYLEILVAFVLLQVTVKASWPTENNPGDGYRLPKNIIPSKYFIKLTPYLDASTSDRFTFKGTVTIMFRTTHNENKDIILHADKDLKFAPGYYIIGNNKKISDITLARNYDYEQIHLHIHGNDSLLVGMDYTLKFPEFTGIIRDDMVGFYRSSYREGNLTKWLASTQFQATHARKVFPCFDEPGFKAIFFLVIDCPMNMKCLSNMKVNNISPYNVYSFKPTPVMSTYTLAFVVSDFTEAGSDEELAVWSRPEASHKGTFAHLLSERIIEYMSNYTSVPYWTLDGDIEMKMDHVAIPDFRFGAMENWGIVTYGEEYLMVDEANTATATKLTAMEVISHEIAHMWFGNLVTCHWWSDVWLNEGLSTFFSYLMTKKVRPLHPGMDGRFVISNMHQAFILDQNIHTSTALTNHVSTPAEIKNQLSYMVYWKGASVIRMMEHLLGPSTFRKGIKYYLVASKYLTVEPYHLFSALQRADDEDHSISHMGVRVKDVFESWTTEPGFPVLYVWINNSMAYVKMDGNFKHLVPITFTTESILNFSDTKPEIILRNETQLTKLNQEWIILNIQHIGYYRVRYSDEIYTYINQYMSTENWNQIHELNRAQIINDALYFAEVEKISFKTALDTIQFLEKETSYTPWVTAYAKFDALRLFFRQSKVLLDRFDMYLRKLMTNVVNHLDSSRDVSDITKIFRTQTMSFACAIKHEKCLEFSKRLFRAWADRNVSVPPDHREFVYCNGIRYGSANDFDKLWNKYLNENHAGEKVLILRSLSCARNRTKIIEYINEMFRVDSRIRVQHQVFAIESFFGRNIENIDPLIFLSKQNGNRIINGDKISDDVAKLLRPFVTIDMPSRKDLERLPEDKATKLKLEGVMKYIKIELARLYSGINVCFSTIEKDVNEWLDVNYGK